MGFPEGFTLFNSSLCLLIGFLIKIFICLPSYTNSDTNDSWQNKSEKLLFYYGASESGDWRCDVLTHSTFLAQRIDVANPSLKIAWCCFTTSQIRWCDLGRNFLYKFFDDEIGYKVILFLFNVFSYCTRVEYFIILDSSSELLSIGCQWIFSSSIFSKKRRWFKLLDRLWLLRAWRM